MPQPDCSECVVISPGTGRVVLVGDPCQLPPTVLSRAAEAALLAQSMFERLARAGWPVTLLREQYRMHPLISAFPSRCVVADVWMESHFQRMYA